MKTCFTFKYFVVYGLRLLTYRWWELFMFVCWTLYPWNLGKGAADTTSKQLQSVMPSFSREVKGGGHKNFKVPHRLLEWEYQKLGVLNFLWCTSCLTIVSRCIATNLQENKHEDISYESNRHKTSPDQIHKLATHQDAHNLVQLCYSIYRPYVMNLACMSSQLAALESSKISYNFFVISSLP